MQLKIELDEILNIFSDFDFLNIKKDYVSGATVKIEKLQYSGPLTLPNSLKVEIDFLQQVILPPIEMEYINAYGIKTKVRVMDIKEIAAEKIRAMNDRVRYRDFYDFAMIMNKIQLNINEVLNLVTKKEIRTPISKDKIIANWNLAKQEKSIELQNIYYKEELQDSEIEKVLNQLHFEDIIK
jgi:predicted nucleotidyltransferase component of viral defense system